MAPASDESPSEKRQCCAHARPGCGGGGCAHLDEHRRAGGARAVDAICRYMRALANRTPSCAPAGADGVSDATGAHTPAFSHQSLPPRRCALCAPGRTGRRVHACLHCVFLGCRAPAGGGGGCCAAGGGGVPSACASTRMGRSGAALAAAAPSGTLSASVAPAGGHLAAHVRETSGTHALALDLDSGEVWCAACADYVYDPLYSAIVASQLGTRGSERAPILPPQPDAIAKHDGLLAASVAPSPPSSAQPSGGARSGAGAGAGDVGGSRLREIGVPRPLLGLRGLNNLGNTCFMNAVLQVLAHNPLIASFFLADHHNRHVCARLRADMRKSRRARTGAATGTGAVAGVGAGAGSADGVGGVGGEGRCGGLREGEDGDGSFGDGGLLPADYHARGAPAAASGMPAVRRGASAASGGHGAIDDSGDLSGASPVEAAGADATNGAPLLDGALGPSASQGEADKAGAETRAAVGGGDDDERLSVCVGCEVDAVFAQLWSGGRSAVNPHQLLCAIWAKVGQLAAYKQQDAHEFYVALLQQLHQTTKQSGASAELAPDAAGGSGPDGGARATGPLSPAPAGTAADCPCFMHRLCCGVLASEVVCATCGHSRAKLETFSDLSCDLLAAADADTAPAATGGAARAHVGGRDGEAAGGDTLRSCLERFTLPECLGTDGRFHCDQCRSLQPSLKQMSIARLPHVLALHLKRFRTDTVGTGGTGGGAAAAGGGAAGASGGCGGGSTGKARAGTPLGSVSAKVDSFVRFPLNGLDMAPYLAHAVARGRERRTRDGARQRGATAGGAVRDGADEGEAGDDEKGGGGDCGGGTIFDCFAVVVHHGTMNAGHYTTYVRHCGLWYACDDAWVVAVSEEEVASARAYLVFYLRRGVTEQALDGVASLVPAALGGGLSRQPDGSEQPPA